MFAASSSSANRCLTVVARLTTTSRSLSYSQRGNPRYSVFNPDCIFNLGVMFPSFRFSRNNYVAVDPMKKGRILFEWVPRSAQGKIIREGITRFALTAEEVGLVVDQLPDNAVEFCRKPGYYNSEAPLYVAAPEDTADEKEAASEDTTVDKPVASPQDGMLEKVLRITPVEGGGVSIKVDFELDGVGGATCDSSTGPMEVITQRGEFVTIRQLLLSSIPALTGWSTLMEIGLKYSFKNAGAMPTGRG